MELKDTCSGEKCKFWNKYKEHCPFYIQTTWAVNSNQPLILHDCTNRRNTLLLLQLLNTAGGMAAAFEEDRNKVHEQQKLLLALVLNKKIDTYLSHEKIMDNPVALALLKESNDEDNNS